MTNRTGAHPDLAHEQAYIERAYARLDQIREEAEDRAASIASQRGSTFQEIYDRDVGIRVGLFRAHALDIGDESLCFGRSDATSGEIYYIGRRAVFNTTHDPLVIDWRVPAAEAFYRATGRDPLGLDARRHFLCEGRRLLSVEEERFSDGTGASSLGLAGSGALITALERPRTGHMRDIVATVQAEQDRIIRDDLDGVLCVQGGPGTGKTAVALHRAAFLLFTHRRKLERQGVLIVGPNPHFLRYIEQVLPALGESGAVLATPTDLIPELTVGGIDTQLASHVKGDVSVAKVLANAVRDRQRPLAKDVKFEFEDIHVTIKARETIELIASARRSRKSHNARHAMLATILVSRLYGRYVRAMKQKHQERADLITMPKRTARPMLRAEPAFLDALDQMWPLLTTERFLSDLLSSRERLAAAAKGVLSDEDRDALYREDGSAWTPADVPLLDEAFTFLGAPVSKRKTDDQDADLDEHKTFGHIVVDEAQDLSPMALRMLTRRSRAGSMTIVGDLAQAVGVWTPRTWDDVLFHLPDRKPRVHELSINYRTPGAIMDVAAVVLAEAAPGMVPPSSVRATGEAPHAISVAPGEVHAEVARIATEHRTGTMVIIAPHSMIASVAAATAAPVEDVGAPVSVFTVEDAKGLEFDEVVIVEPARLVDESMQGLRALYVALTRATQRVFIVHSEALPRALHLPT